MNLFSILRRSVCAALLTACATTSALAAAAGYQRVQVPDGDDKPIETSVWYPTEAVAASSKFGPFDMTVAMNAPVAGRGLPLVVISHGNGGSALSHHDTAVALAQAGFVVAAVAHTGDNHADQSREVSMMDRPRHLSRTIDYLLTQWPSREQLDASRVGVFGFSSGGFTAMAISGGEPDLARVGPHCRDHASHYACKVLARRAAQAQTLPAGPQSARDPRVKAAVVAAPALGFTFTRESLAAVSIPVQLWRAEADEVLPHPFYAEAVRAGLPKTVDYREVPDAGHFDFLAPCSMRFSLMAAPLCTSHEGFDRVAFHQRFNAAVVEFFSRTLAAPR